ncbi:MAG: ATP-binding cassette domain-containing protein [Firmicutes bacterium]|nr:ATP-binding cassette domain-containing protein [Bacillota bacterium]
MLAIRTKNLGKEFWRQKKAGGLLGSLRSLYKQHRESVVAVHSLDLEIPRGETVAFIGPNGAGKSTTIKMLTGILHPSYGDAQVLGFTPWQERQKLAFHIGTVFGQKSQLWYHLPAADSFFLLGRIYVLDRHTFQQRQAELVERFELKEFFHVPVRKLSLGQRMRAELAAALLHSPQVLFLDEPTIGLDVVARQNMRNLIKEINGLGITVFLTSHDTGDIENLCRRVIMIHNGQVVIDQSINSLKRNHLATKIIRVRLETPIDSPPAIAGAQVLKHKGAGLKISLDTTKLSVDELYMRLRQLAPIADITIGDPPLEDIIANIYRHNQTGDDTHELAQEVAQI